MDLRQMRYFLAVVDSGGVHRAAEKLHVAQSSLSQTIRSMEKALGVELFHRVGRTLVLAPAGEALVAPARQVLQTVENANRAVGDVAALRTGHLKVASLSDIAVDPIATWIARFLVENPGMQCGVTQSAQTADVLEAVRTGAADVGFVSTDAVGELDKREVVNQLFVLVCPPGSEERFPPVVPIAELAEESFVLGQQGTGTRDFLDHTLRSHGVEPRIAVEIDQREALLPLVLAGCGLGIVPLRVAHTFWTRGGVVPELEPTPTTVIYAVTRPGMSDAIVERFLDVVDRSVAVWVEALRARAGGGTPLIELADAAIASLEPKNRAR